MNEFQIGFLLQKVIYGLKTESKTSMDSANLRVEGEEGAKMVENEVGLGVRLL